jgi:antitoxin component of MazEF toxin-antitoxin module
MLQAIEFPTILRDNQHIDIPSDLQSQLKANQSIRVIVLVKDEVEETPKKKRQLGTLAGKISIPDDFDEPLEDLNEYMY